MNAQHLIYEAQKAAHYGLNDSVAFMAVTSVPAKRLGQGWRIGQVKEGRDLFGTRSMNIIYLNIDPLFVQGYDADVIIWNRNPLELGAKPLATFIDVSNPPKIIYLCRYEKTFLKKKIT